jgi:hypothetical protein
MHHPVNWRRALIILVIAAWTVWVGISGAVFNLSGLDVCIANGYSMEHLCWYVPEFSPLLRPLVLRPEALASWQSLWMLFAAVVLAFLITSGPSLPCIGAALRLGRRSSAAEQ